MSRFGPLPEMPTVKAQIPHMDLRDAIRLEHGLEPLDPKDVPRYTEPPLFSFDTGETPPRTRDEASILTRTRDEASIWTLRNIGLIVLCIGILAASLFPTFALTALALLWLFAVIVKIALR